ncbi:hypothetical protein [Rhizobium sp. LEGMi135b]
MLGIVTNAKGGKNARPILLVALEVVHHIDRFDIKREINGLSVDECSKRRQKDSRSLIDELQDWLRCEQMNMSWSSPVTVPID